MVVLAVLLMMAFCLPASAQQGAACLDLLIKSEVETAVSLLAAIHARHQKGEMTLEAAKALGANLLRELRFGSDGYFWADTTEGVNVVLYGRRRICGISVYEERTNQSATQAILCASV